MKSRDLGINDFRREFKEYGREDNFSYDGLEHLFNYLEEFENYELDVIAICCDFSELSLEEYYNNYSLDDDYDDDDELKEIVERHANYNTSVVFMDHENILFSDF